MERYVCIHGHFYQPPRENPWLEEIEVQDSAYPYHDWNERITAECYGPNGTSRILDETGNIVKIHNNYSRISFNFGPTLLSWMEEKAPDVYRSIFEADKLSVERFSGHGSAMAQVYNHLIMPLANERDKETQVIWGIKDFEYRFGRKPEGMWLAETAVDVASLEILAKQGIKFTVLAPYQAARFKQIDSPHWTDVAHTGIDSSRPYRVHLPSGQSIAVFFYDGNVSRAIAFEKLLERGENVVGRLMGAFSNTNSSPQIVSIATDGESYGHHHRYGDMALAYALDHLETRNDVKLTNYAEFLAKFPPTFEVQIRDNSSWSCAHGVERWRSNCGCNTGGAPNWNQSWRTPLRESLDWLRDALNPLYQDEATKLLREPWFARNAYIDILMDRNPDAITEFISHHAHRELNHDERIRVLKLLEMQRQMLLMYTSCGWFFNDISGIETVQVLQYAGRAIQLAEQLFGQNFEEAFLQRLEKAKSNIPEMGDGRNVYAKFVKAAIMDLPKVAAHYAITSLFDNGTNESKTYCYSIDYNDYKTFTTGKARLSLGWMKVESEITYESENLSFGILHLGDHNLEGGVKSFDGDQNYNSMAEQISTAFKKADFTETFRLIDRNFGPRIFSLKSLFKDEQRLILTSILETQLAETESVLRQIYENNAPMMRFLADLMVPLPNVLKSASEFSLNTSLRHALESDDLDVERIQLLLAEAREARVTLEGPGLAYGLEKNLDRIMEQIWTDPSDPSFLQMCEEAVSIVALLPFEVNLWNVQNNFYELMERIYPNLKKQAEAGDESSVAWIKSFLTLGNKLRVKIPD